MSLPRLNDDELDKLFDDIKRLGEPVFGPGGCKAQCPSIDPPIVTVTYPDDETEECERLSDDLNGRRWRKIPDLKRNIVTNSDQK